MKEFLIGFLTILGLALIIFVIFALPQIIEACKERKRLRELEREKARKDGEALAWALNMQMLIYSYETEQLEKKINKLEGKENQGEWTSFELPSIELTIENKENEDHSTDW